VLTVVVAVLALAARAMLLVHGQDPTFDAVHLFMPLLVFAAKVALSRRCSGSSRRRGWQAMAPAGLPGGCPAHPFASARDATQLALLVHPATPADELLVNGRRLESLPRPNGWTRLVVCGRLRDGVTVELVTGADAEVELVVIDQTHDLFDNAALDVPPRPPGTMPAPSRMSDAVLVVRALSAPPSGAATGEAD
jgi:hypothetical protein